MTAAAPRYVTLGSHKLDRPGHLCAFFDSCEQEYEVLAPYYREGIAEGEQVVNIVDAERHSDHCHRLRANGIDVDGAVGPALETDPAERVPEDHETIQGAVDAASPGDIACWTATVSGKLSNGSSPPGFWSELPRRYGILCGNSSR